MKLVTLDFESFWSKEYSLRHLTTEEYCRDPRFKAHLVGYAVDDAPPRWSADVDRVIGEIEALGDVAMLCHHAQFDGLILSHHYDYRPALWLDTLSMARIAVPHGRHSLDKLGEAFNLGRKGNFLDASYGIRDLTTAQLYALGEGCIGDVARTRALFKVLAPAIPRAELRLIDLTIRMFTEPELVLDRPRLQAEYDRVVAGKAKLLNELGVTRDELQSAERFATLLSALGVEPPTKASPTDPARRIYAFAKTDDAMRELAEHPDERVQNLVAARLGVRSTLGETRCERLLEMDGRGALAVYLRHAGAHTGRWSGGDQLNWQNFPRGGEIRRSIRAPAGWKIVVGDLAQIECRLVNWLAGQWDVVERFAAGADPYLPIAGQFYGRAITKADKPERQFGKVLELASGFGMGPDKFHATAARAGVQISVEEATRAVRLYRDTHRAVQRLWKFADTVIATLRAGGSMEWSPMRVAGGIIYLPGGYPLDYRGIKEDETGELSMEVKPGKWRKLYGAKLVENVVQALARVILGESMLTIAARGYRIVGTVHDEVLVLAKGGDAAAKEYVKQDLERQPTWAVGLPLAAEVSEGENYEK